MSTLHVASDGILYISWRVDWKTPVLQAEVAAVLAAIDAGHIDALRHYAEHGTLSLEPPVWPNWEVTPRNPGIVGWDLRRQHAGGIAVGGVTTGADRRWVAWVSGFTGSGGHDTPQAAVDALRAELREMLGP